MMNITSLRKFLQAVLSLVFLGWLLFGSVGQASAASVIYVNAAAAGLNNGSSWANAYKSLQSALTAAAGGQQIWVAKGTYRPATTDRTVSFVLKNGVAVYGGFAGTETLLSQRNFTTNLTVLSGDIGTLGIATDNSYHVVDGSGVDSTAILDGFTIMDGYSVGGFYPDTASGGGIFDSAGSPTLNNLIVEDSQADNGGGMENYAGSHPTLTHVTFKNDKASLAGGGMYNDASTPTLTNVTFSGNSAYDGAGMTNSHSNPTLTTVTFTGNSATYGGGMYDDGGGPTLTGVTFSSNSAGKSGGWIFDSASSPTLTQVTFSSNSAGDSGGGMYNDSPSNPVLTETIFDANTAVSNGGGIADEGSSPMLTDVTFSGNKVTSDVGNGGGMYNHNGSNAGLKNVTFSGNTVLHGFGGGMANFLSSDSFLSNVTFSSNTAFEGGGMANDSSGPTLDNVTFSGNSADNQSGAILDYDSHPLIYNSIFWGDNSEIANTSSTATINDSLVAGGCPVTSTCTHVIDADPVLGPLQNNGGFTQTMALGAGSAAIDAGNNATCASTDQRGVSRPQGPACDMGAYEVKALGLISLRSYDGWVKFITLGNSQGDSLNTAAPIFFVSGDNSPLRYRGFLSFDTHPLPDSATIVSAQVRVMPQGAAGNPAGSPGMLMADFAAPFFGSGLGLETSDFDAPASQPRAAVLTPGPGGWYAANLNGDVLTEIERTSTLQFRLRLNSPSSGGALETLTFYSGDAPDPALRPVLLVYYNP